MSDQKHLDELARIAELGSALIDGEDTLRIIADRSYWWIVNKDSVSTAMSGDYYDVDFDKFLRLKKLTTRISWLVDFPVGCCIWVRVKGLEDEITLALRNGSLMRYAGFREWSRVPDGALAECLDRNEVVPVPESDDGMLSALGPLRDSLGDSVGIVEFSALSSSAEAAPAFN